MSRTLLDINYIKKIHQNLKKFDHLFRKSNMVLMLYTWTNKYIQENDISKHRIYLKHVTVASFVFLDKITYNKIPE